MNCPFCDLKEERIIEETKNTFTILSNPAIVKGHLLVIPKRHAEKLSELNGDEKIELFNQVIKMQEILLRKFSGCDIRQNYRPFQAQDSLKVNHLHIHLQHNRDTADCVSVLFPEEKEMILFFILSQQSSQHPPESFSQSQQPSLLHLSLRSELP